MANEVAKQQKVTIQSLVHNEEFVSKAQDILQDGTPHQHL